VLWWTWACLSFKRATVDFNHALPTASIMQAFPRPPIIAIDSFRCYHRDSIPGDITLEIEIKAKIQQVIFTNSLTGPKFGL
jgi:hypothetical protein